MGSGNRLPKPYRRCFSNKKKEKGLGEACDMRVSVAASRLLAGPQPRTGGRRVYKEFSGGRRKRQETLTEERTK